VSTSETTAPHKAKLKGKALVTGASGFIGGRLRDRLLDDGLDVISMRRKGSPASKKGRSVEVGYEDAAGLTKVFADEQPDYVFHVAGVTKGVTYHDFQQGNVMPTKALIRAAKESKVSLKRFVHFSSLAAFGPSSPKKPHQETDVRKPIEFYGKSKFESEEAMESAELPWTIIRPGGVYGPGDVDYFKLFQEASKGRNVFFGNRDRWFSGVYVDDLVEASMLGAAAEATKNKGYFVCDGRPVTWGEFQACVVSAAGRNVMTLNLPEILVDIAAIGGELMTRLDKKPRLFNKQKALMGAQSAWTCTSEALAKDAQYKPQVMIEEGCKLAFDWYRKERWL
jgi:nucleoside-diphosphate-sugar epimerase